MTLTSTVSQLLPMRYFKQLRLLASILLLLSLLLTSCAIPRVTAESRTFLNLSLDFLGEYQLPQTTFEGTRVGGLSAIAYDRQRDRFYALSDDRSEFSPARFYTLKLVTSSVGSDADPGIQKVEIEAVTFLKGADGELYPKGTINPEGIGVSAQQSVFVSSEGVAPNKVAPFINEFDLQTGALRQSLPIPKYYLPNASESEPQTGIQDNLGFEALTLSPGGFGGLIEPFRVFVATESALAQDQEAVDSGSEVKNRLLHYLAGDGPPLLISEHLYLLDAPPAGAIKHGLTELMALDQGGHFLSLERSLEPQGFRDRIYQIATGGATDISGVTSLQGNVGGIEPVKKKLLLDLSELGIRLDNLEGMTLGPRLGDGSQSLILISDDNFSDTQVSQLLLFRLVTKG